MPRDIRCTVCQHERVSEVDALMLAQCTSIRKIAEQFGLNRNAVHAHQTKHLVVSQARRAEHSRQLARVTHTSSLAPDAETVLGQLSDYKAECDDILRETKESKNYKVALQAIEQASKLLEQAERLVQSRQASVRDLSQTPQFKSLSSVIINALLPWPEAAQAVTDAIYRHVHEHQP